MLLVAVLIFGLKNGAEICILSRRNTSFLTAQVRGKTSVLS